MSRRRRWPAAPISRDPTVAAYEAHADRFEDRASQAGRRLSPLLAATLNSLPPRSRVLDLGCGSGHDALVFLRAGHVVHGVDATEIFLERAARRARRFGSRAQFELADIRTWVPPASRYDLVWANASLIHVPKKRIVTVLRRLRISLRRTGRLVATIHNGRREGVHPGTWIPGRFFASFLKKELLDYVKSAGFREALVQGVVNEDRKGRWLNLLAGDDGAISGTKGSRGASDSAHPGSRSSPPGRGSSRGW